MGQPAVFSSWGWCVLKNIGLDVGTFVNGAEVYLPLYNIDPRYPLNRTMFDPIAAYSSPSAYVDGAQSPSVTLKTLLPYGDGGIAPYDILTALTQGYDFTEGYQLALKIADGTVDGDYSFRYINYAQCNALVIEQEFMHGSMYLTMSFRGTDGRPEGDTDDEFTSGIVFDAVDGSTVLGPFVDMSMTDFDGYADGVYGCRLTVQFKTALQFGSPDPNYPTRPAYIASGVTTGPIMGMFEIIQSPLYDYTPSNGVVVRTLDTMNQYIYLNPNEPVYPIIPNTYSSVTSRYNLMDITEDDSVWPVQFGPYA